MIHAYESKPTGIMSGRLINDPHRHKIGDIIKVRRDDGSFDQYIVTNDKGCHYCVCFKTNRCPLYKLQGGIQNCILCYGYPETTPSEMALQSIDSMLEDL